MTEIFIPHWTTAVVLLWAAAIVLIFVVFPALTRRRREHIIARLRDGADRASPGEQDYIALVDELAEIDRAPFNGHYYWHKCVKPGVDPDSLIGLRGAIRAGGLGAGRAYGQIISGKAGRDE